MIERKTEKVPQLVQSNDAQIDRFKQTARELGCDETGEAFERTFAKAVPARKRKEAEPKDEPS